MERLQRIETWLSGLWPGTSFTLAPASADASFRRYFRASRAGGDSLIVMDAPPSHEDVGPWLKVQQLFHEAGVHVPDVLATNLDQGFLLLSDLGNTTYLAALTPERVAAIPGDYLDAIDALIKIQAASRPGCLPDYDRALLQRELDLFPDWYIGRHLNLTLDDSQRQALSKVFEQILAVNLAEPRVFVHRDYHSRNLMLMEGAANPGIIDFQDAVHGPISYDLVSLLKDAYVDWDEEVALDWLVRYWERAKKAGLPVRPDFAEFHRDYEWMGVQRHLKVLGIFARLCHRDGKDGYLKDMPLVAKYLRRAVERYDELNPLRKLLDQLEGKVTVLGQTMDKKTLGVRSGD
ncbi:aminoglycoside phosphotransferase family protein [Denitratisoma oestradiolicum]|uniref:N-acetylmuramate/N-acetylglucosamine kinase n=1 Tax=Denitratisoma oestradiolicum TaxID=311182 RepID=A0A6S6Y0J6_9PROT|nr:phosphotransferase [Denitratisoma oestradiolicum]TWO80152.1 aminoglycoside phosphotransferase [Denitratisoma oestradiolicum]CAB1370005.1 N-acetylmuramate/N-acetylglucosamine kinase [Denitratisoma oestradiolicum]